MASTRSSTGGRRCGSPPIYSGDDPPLRLRRVTLWLEAGPDQFPLIVARLEGSSVQQTVEVTLSASGYRVGRIRAIVCQPPLERPASTVVT